MQGVLGKIHTGLGLVTFLAILAQFFLAGVGVFGAGSYDAHVAVGSAIALLALLLLIVAAAGRLGRRRIGISAVLVGLMIVQIALIESHQPWVEALHPVNALLIMGASAQLTPIGDALAGRRGRAAQAEPGGARATSHGG